VRLAGVVSLLVLFASGPLRAQDVERKGTLSPRQKTAIEAYVRNLQRLRSRAPDVTIEQVFADARVIWDLITSTGSVNERVRGRSIWWGIR
jgi:hypothetical protein